MIIGVPIFAVVIELTKRMLEKRLSAKGEPTDTVEYYPDNAVGNAEQDMYYEHSTLLYNYQRSRLKPHVDRIRNGILAHLGRQSKTEAPPAEDTSPQSKSQDPDGSDHTES
jgi:hypothetical protein